MSDKKTCEVPVELVKAAAGWLDGVGQLQMGDELRACLPKPPRKWEGVALVQSYWLDGVLAGSLDTGIGPGANGILLFPRTTAVSGGVLVRVTIEEIPNDLG